jgi:hypothetical protein
MSRILGGKAFILGGSTDLREESPGIYSGDLSGMKPMRSPGGRGPTPFHRETWRSSLIGRRRLIRSHGSRLIEEAIAAAAAGINADVVDYCVAPVFPESAGRKASHHYVVEFASGPPHAI